MTYVQAAKEEIARTLRAQGLKLCLFKAEDVQMAALCLLASGWKPALWMWEDQA